MRAPSDALRYALCGLLRSAVVVSSSLWLIGCSTDSRGGSDDNLARTERGGSSGASGANTASGANGRAVASGGNPATAVTAGSAGLGSAENGPSGSGAGGIVGAGGTIGAGGATGAGGSCVSSDALGPDGGYVPASYTVACGARDRFTWPFAKESIWNMPIGSEAKYVDAGLGTMGACNVDNDFVLRENAADPAHEVYRPDRQYGVDGKGGTGKVVHIPDSFTYKGGPNNGASFFDVDARTFKEFAAFARETASSDPTGWDWGSTDVTDLGSHGGHAGSGLSVVGGTLRPGELENPEPIRHALKVELDWVVLSPDWPGKFRWPAQNSDSYGNNTYSGTVKALTMGSLVALKPDFDVEATIWRTAVGKKIAHAFQDYGAYVVDTTANGWKWDNGGYTMALCAQNESIAEAKSAFGIDWASGWGAGGEAWTADMQVIYAHLSVVDNNAASSIGGGGAPRRPLAPDFAQ